jgi:hypothetical protein
MITWDFASAADILAYYGEVPPETIRAIAIRIDDAPVAIIGMAYERDRLRAFSEFREDLAPCLRSMPVLRAIKAAQRMFAGTRRPLIAVRECGSGILERLGFEQLEGEVYVWRG